MVLKGMVQSWEKDLAENQRRTNLTPEKNTSTKNCNTFFDEKKWNRNWFRIRHSRTELGKETTRR